MFFISFERRKNGFSFGIISEYMEVLVLDFKINTLKINVFEAKKKS